MGGAKSLLTDRSSEPPASMMYGIVALLPLLVKKLQILRRGRTEPSNSGPYAHSQHIHLFLAFACEREVAQLPISKHLLLEVLDHLLMPAKRRDDLHHP